MLSKFANFRMVSKTISPNMNTVISHPSNYLGLSYCPKNTFFSQNGADGQPFRVDSTGRYTPQKQLIFKKERSKIYDYMIYGALTNGYFVMLAIGGLLSAYFIGKIVDFRERGFFGFVFYGMGATLLIPKVLSLAMIYSRIVNKIYLTRSGSSIIVKHAKYGFLPTYSKFKIEEISKPLDPSNALAVTKFAYPILINNQLFYLPRDPEYFNTEILPVVFNNIQINTDDEYAPPRDEIVI